MRVREKSNNIWILVLVFFLFIVLILASATANAETTIFLDSFQKYEGSDDSLGYSSNSSFEVEKFSYGDTSIGTFSLSGSSNKSTVINGFQAFAISDGLTIKYAYDGAYRTNNKEEWNLVSDSSKAVDSVPLSKKVQEGVLLIQKSSNGTRWENAIDPIYDCFSSKKIDWDSIYSIPDNDLKSGMYYRVLIAYEMGRKTGHFPGSTSPFEMPHDIYQYSYCLEKYQFYACYGKSFIEFRDISSGSVLTSGYVVQGGFVVDKNGSSNIVSVKRNTDTPIVIESLTSFTDVGKYTITETTPLGQVYTFYIEISGGLKTITLTPALYQNEKKEYTTNNRVDGIKAFNSSSHTLLSIGQYSGNSVVKSTYNGFDAYGVTGNGVGLYMQLKKGDSLKTNGWEIIQDTWGKRESQCVDGVYAGQINSGALIVQTSSNGTDWVDIDKGRYAQGLYTTDYETYYGNRGDVLIYTPDGNDILNGVYIRVLYAYEIKSTSSKDDYRIIEEYKLYICSDELNAVTFHNLSLNTSMKEICEGYDDATAQVYKRAETMLTNAYTVSGFEIDNSLNPTVSYSVKRNGTNYSVSGNKQITATGKYQIHLTSAVNSTRDVTIYVDRMDTGQALEFYFGDSFIQGKRIYSEGEFAVYEGGKTQYQILQVNDNFLPLGGEIHNTTTGEIITITADRREKKGTLTNPGVYEVILSTNPKYDTESTSGDCRTFIFHFVIIAEGTAPGPVVNHDSLVEYASTTITDSYPKYYGLVFSSASNGNITLAFATRDAAKKYALNYEQGMVEKQPDGSYRYTGSFKAKQKEKYDSNWDLMDAINYFADQAVMEFYFDLSDPFMVTTLTDELISATSNIRTLELNNSIVIFAEGQKAELTSLANSVPIISPKPFYYLEPGSDGTIEAGFNDFEFVKDKYGCDSSSVVVIDSNGKLYNIAYNRGVGKQLESAGCPSGILKVVEKTIYGDETSYDVVYIASGKNTAKVTVSYYENGKENEYVFSQENDGDSLIAETFSISEFVDELDPYSLIIVSSEKGNQSYVADELLKDAWSDPGEYDIKVVNRLGFSYSFAVTVTESDFATILFEGDGTSSASYILTKYGQTHVKLPELTRIGYDFVGFVDADDNQYTDEIERIQFRGSVILTAIWKPKQFTLTYQDMNGQVIGTSPIEFGKTIELQTPNLGDGYTFTGWSIDGVLLKTNTFSLVEEGNVTLIATGELLKDMANDSMKATSMNKLGLVLLLGIAFVVVYSLVRKNQTENTILMNESFDYQNEEERDEQ